MSNPDLWMQTFSKRPFRFDDMRDLDVAIEDLAIPLSRLPRFGGHAEKDLKVGEHCLVVSKLYSIMRPDDPLGKLHALLHDAHEAFGWGDMPAPFKRFLMWAHSIDVKAMQAEMQVNLLAALGVPMLEDIKQVECIEMCDIMACKIERDLFLPSSLQWQVDHISYDLKLQEFYLYLSPFEIAHLFIDQFKSLFEEVHAQGPMAPRP